MSALASHRRPGEAWQAEHGPALKALDEQRRKDRERATMLVRDGLKDAPDADRALVEKITGLFLTRATGEAQ